MPYLLGFGIPIGYIAMWTLTAKILFRRYHLIEGEKRNCPERAEHPSWHGSGTSYCIECGRTNKQWWQEEGITASRGLSDPNLTWDCIVQAFLWPISLTLWLMITSITANPPKSPREVEAERDKLLKRTAALEKDNQRLEKALEDAK